MRRCQHTVCQCRRASAPACVGHTTTCGIPGNSSWSQPGQRYALAAAAPGTWRTTQSPSGQSSIRSGPSGAAGAAGPPRRTLRALTGIKGIRDLVRHKDCLLYTSDAADDLLCVDLGGRRIIKKKKKKQAHKEI